MDNQKEEPYIPKPIKYIGIFCIWFFVWFLGGGLITFAPALAHGTNTDVLGCGVTAWASFPFTISADYIFANKFTDKLVIANFLLWLFCIGWVWLGL
jgi:hypothetical protein